MKQKYNKKYLKTNFISFIIALIIFGSIGVYAAITFPSNDVSYDNSVSGLKSTSVKDAIDELYTECTKELSAGDTILDNTDIVTSGDGLYEDEYEDGRYFYKGANPNNYVTFNNEKAGWRIISIEPDKTVKIMRIDGVTKQNWDDSGSNNWNRPATLNTYLNSTYYSSLTGIAQKQMVSHNFSIGAIEDKNNSLEIQIDKENSKDWFGKIALPTLSEYLRSNSNKNDCGTITLNNRNYGRCSSTNWMYNSNIDYWYTLTAYDNYVSVFNLITHTTFYNENINSGVTDGAVAGTESRPTLYLSSSVKITGGTGTQADPYTIE